MEAVLVAGPYPEPLAASVTGGNHDDAVPALNSVESRGGSVRQNAYRGNLTRGNIGDRAWKAVQKDKRCVPVDRKRGDVDVGSAAALIDIQSRDSPVQGLGEVDVRGCVHHFASDAAVRERRAALAEVYSLPDKNQSVGQCPALRFAGA